ncbi:acyltransferase domain-containing protein [Streptomyces sp. NPDC001848]|uniref:acyltransferase domain-containing protein n=1 Tax=Streptomyces sp. NPDC001848 TaxID=3364618 RepID=UPI00367F6071
MSIEDANMDREGRGDMTAWEPADGEAHVAVIGMAVRFGAADDLDTYRELLRGSGGADPAVPLVDAYAFDNRFFGISPRESALLDPQQRILLECAHRALEDAAHDPSGDKRVVGIYAGGSSTAHAARLRDRTDRLPYLDDRQVRASTGADFLAARAAYRLGLTGPAVSVQAAGATALVAVHTAVQALLGGECDLALAGAVTVRTEEDGADGAGGCAMVALKPLEAAVADGDRIYAVVRGTAVGRSGPGESEQQGRERIARDAHLVGGVDPETVTAVDAAPALHVTDVAPGMAAFVRAVLAVYDPEPSAATAARPRRAGVSVSAPFGCHACAIVEEPPAPEERPDEASSPDSWDWQLLPFSARTSTALADTAARLRDHLQRSADVALRDVAWTLQTGRTAHARRGWVVARDAAEAAQELGGVKLPGAATGPASAGAPPVVFTFPGHGGQHLGMARQLYRTDPHFRTDVDAGAQLARAELDLDLRAVLNPVGVEAEEAARRALADGGIAQIAVFVVEYALARALMRWGVRPAAVAGHSLGGYAAACIAGVVSFPDAFRMVVDRTRLLLTIAPGAMAAVRMPEHELLPLLPEGVDIGVISGPDQVTITGPRTLVEQFVEDGKGKGIETRLLNIPGAGHSSLVEPVLGEYAERLKSVEFRSPQIRVVSDSTGTWADPERIATAGYWCDHMRGTVRYHDVLQTLDAYEGCVLLEVGPGTTLTSLARRHAGLRAGHLVLHTLPHPTDPTADTRTVLDALGALWAAGTDIDWSALHTGARPRRTGLPGHPLRRDRFPLPTG